MQYPVETEIAKAPDRSSPVALRENLFDLPPEAIGRNGFEAPALERRPNRTPGLPRNPKTESVRVTDRPKRPGGVVHRGAIVEKTDDSVLQVPPPSGRIEQVTLEIGSQFEGKRIDGEIPAKQVMAYAGRTNDRKGPGALVGFRARRGDVHAFAARQRQRGRTETGMHDDIGAAGSGERPRKGGSISFYGQVDIADGAPQEQVAHRSADEIKRLAPLSRDPAGGVHDRALARIERRQNPALLQGVGHGAAARPQVVTYS